MSQDSPTKPPKKPRTVPFISYIELQTQRSPTQTKIRHFLPGLGKLRQVHHRLIENQEEEETIEPNLFISAKHSLQHQPEPEFTDEELSHFFGASSFLMSKYSTSTPNRNRLFRNRMNSMCVDRLEFSKPDETALKEEKIKQDTFRIKDEITGQCDVVFRYVFGKQKTINTKLVQQWKECLYHEDKANIFLPIADEQVRVPYTFPRIFTLNDIDKGFKSIYGSGKNKGLQPGQEALIIDCIYRYLRCCSNDSVKIARKDYDIVNTIIADAKLQELEGYPNCIKQIETHFKIMATRWKYSGRLNRKDRNLEASLIGGKGNFIDLTKKGILSTYLLTQSNINDI